MISLSANIKKITLILTGLFVVIVGSYIFLNRDVEPNLNTTQITFPDTINLSLTAWTVTTAEELSRGLSVVDYMTEQQGMLFIFDESKQHSFWMKDMKFPIDIIWLDENKKIVDIKENAHPSDFPETYQPRDESRYVLETVSGFTNKQRLKVGDQLQWEM